MNKCKCIKDPSAGVGESKFKVNNYYEFDYIPPIKDNPSYYRVFSTSENLSENFNIKHFNEYFKKY
ncbi:hypothetical protein CYCD_26610 [Tenuifilaceae bacterium CYCD]|nr:hypothetical protein CYCD_26610 [Tenuifilaceae bacterium CYCD]